MDKLKILGFAGSLRKDSYNRALLRAAAEMLPDDVELEIFDLEGLPLFNQDLESEPTEKVKEFKAKIRAADGILIATPEYNYSIPGVLKNAIDIASRPYGGNAFNSKPLGIMGASIGNLGTARAQYHLRQSCVFLNMPVMNQPEIMVSIAQDKFDENGKLVDKETRNRLSEFIQAFTAWVRKMK